jgi:hypothetical protein
MALLSLYYRELRIWWFFGNYWPDDYILAAFRFTDWFKGVIPWSEVTSFLQEYRNGQVFVFPALIGAWMTFGLDPKMAFMLNTVLFLGLNLVMLLLVVKKFKLWSWKNPMGTLLLFTTNISILRVVSGMTILIAVLTRLALLPLLCVPPAFGAWKLLFGEEKKIQAGLRMAIPGLVAAGGLFLIYTSFGLFGSFDKAREFAAQPHFTDQFNFLNFSWLVLVSFQFGLIALIGSIRRLREHDGFVILAGSFLGILLLLYLGKVAPWLRYGGPMGVCGVLMYLYVVRDYFTARWKAVLSILIITVVNLIPLYNIPNLLD